MPCEIVFGLARSIFGLAKSFLALQNRFWPCEINFFPILVMECVIPKYISKSVNILVIVMGSRFTNASRQALLSTSTYYISYLHKREGEASDDLSYRVNSHWVGSGYCYVARAVSL